MLETVNVATRPSTAAFWSGWVITGLTVLFLLFDSVSKILKASAAVQGTVQLGFPPSVLVGLGITLLSCTVLYALPRTAVLGAVLLTGYFGGAVATQVRVGNSIFLYVLFPVYFAILMWLSIYLRLPRLRSLLPLVRAER